MYIQFDVAAFRLAYPAFANPNTFYADATLQQYWNSAINYISNYSPNCSLFPVAKQALALNYMTAHLAELSNIIRCGNTPGMVTSATIDKVSVTLQPPPEVNQWQWWLNLTPYGQQLLALLQVASVGGMYFGGRPEIAAFRKTGGQF